MPFEPRNVIRATTMAPDVILSCLVFASCGLFLLADRERSGAKGAWLFVAAGALMVAAFLVKITILPVLLALGLFSAIVSIRDRAIIRRHLVFYGTFALGFACICAVYYVKKGDLLWQFRSELTYYRAPGPPDPPRLLDYRTLLMEYPRSLFGRSGYERYRYFEHGLLFWVFVPAAVWLGARRREAVTGFFIV